jgi:hypothetical protein
MPDGESTTTESQETQSANPPNAQSAGDGTATNAGQGERTYSNEEVQRIVSDRLRQAQKATEAKAIREKEEADSLRLKEQAEWEKLANQHEAKVKELAPQLESLTAERDKLREHLAASVAQETKDWPKEVKDLLPDTEDVLLKLDAVARTRALAAKLVGTPPPAGNGPNPRPAGAAGQTGTQEIIEQKRSSGAYSPF